MSRALRAFGSIELTLPGMLALLLGALASYRVPAAPLWWLAGPLAWLSLNLLAAIAVNRRFRGQPGLLVFHVALLVLVALAGLGYLTRFTGEAELVEGQPFSPDTVLVQARGPWHAGQIDEVRFVQDRIRVEYGPDGQRARIESRVRYSGEGGEAAVVVGDTRPLRVGGYRLYATANKGYAALVHWMDAAGREQIGAMHFPSYPLWDWRQVSRWAVPGGPQLELELDLPLRPAGAWVLQSRGAEARLRVPTASGVASLAPGDSLALAGGVLRYEGVRLWMGYRVVYEPWLPWLASAALTGVAGLGWHFWMRMRTPLGASRAKATDGHGALPAHP